MDEASSFLNDLEEKARSKFGFSISKTINGFKGEWFEKMSGTDDLWEFRIKQAGNIYRLFAFWDGEGEEATLIVCTHGIQKKTQKTPPREIEKATHLKKLYFEMKRSK